MLWLPSFLTDALACALTVYTTADTVRSFQAAMDLREVLTRLTEENEDLRRLAKRAEVISAFAEEDLRRFRERTEVERLLRQERWEDTLQQLRDARIKRARRRQLLLEESLRRRTTAKLKALDNIREALEAYRDRLETARDLTGEALEARMAEIQQLLEQLRDREAVSAPARPGGTVSPCGSCGAIPPPPPRPFPRRWIPAEAGRPRWRTASKRTAAQPKGCALCAYLPSSRRSPSLPQGIPAPRKRPWRWRRDCPAGSAGTDGTAWPCGRG